MDDIYVYSVRLPDKIDELVTPCIGGYTVWLSDRWTMHTGYGHIIMRFSILRTGILNVLTFKK